MLHIVEGDRVDRVDLVLAVEGGVEGVHHHHELLPLRRLRVVGVAGLGRVPVLGRVGVDDEGAVEPLVDVAFQGRGVAVVEVAAEGLGRELVDELVADLDLAPADPGDAVVEGAVDAVEVHRVGVGAGVGEVDPQPIALVGAQGRAGHLAVVGPGREEDAGRDLDLLVEGGDLPLADDGAVGHLGRLAVVEGVHQDRGIEAHARDVDVADGGAEAVPGVAGVEWVALCLRLRLTAVSLSEQWQRRGAKRGRAERSCSAGRAQAKHRAAIS